MTPNFQTGGWNTVIFQLHVKPKFRDTTDKHVAGFFGSFENGHFGQIRALFIIQIINGSISLKLSGATFTKVYDTMQVWIFLIRPSKDLLGYHCLTLRSCRKQLMQKLPC